MQLSGQGREDSQSEALVGADFWGTLIVLTSTINWRGTEEVNPILWEIKAFFTTPIVYSGLLT